MTNKTVTMPRELAERLDSPHSSVRNAAIESLRRILAKPDAGITASVAAPVVERQPEPVKIDIDRLWSDYPLGTKAVAIGGGHWVKNINGWKWFCGSTFPTPGGDARWVILPEASPPARVAVIKPVVWRIPVNGDWFYGTKEQCARERAEYESTFTAEDFEDNGVVEPEPLACLDKVKEMNR